FVRQIWSALGEKAASVGTLGIVSPGFGREAGLTTPDPVQLHADLATLAREGVTHLAIEASSHGLDQHRLDGLELSAAAFTNLTHEHLDYHPSMEAYFAAKARLFEALLPADGTAVVNGDSDRAVQLGEICARRFRPAGQRGRCRHSPRPCHWPAAAPRTGAPWRRSRHPLSGDSRDARASGW